MANITIDGKQFQVEDPNALTVEEYNKIMDAFGIDKSASRDEQILQYKNMTQGEKENALTKNEQAEANIGSKLGNLAPEARQKVQEMIDGIEHAPQSQNWWNEVNKIVSDISYREAKARDPLGTLGQDLRGANVSIPFFPDIKDGKLDLPFLPNIPLTGALPLDRTSWGVAGSLIAPNVVGLNPITGFAKQPLKMAGADVLGYHIGTHAHDAANQIYRWLADLPDDDFVWDREKTKLLREYADNLAWTGGAYAMLPLYQRFGKPVMRGIFGIDKKSTQDLVNLSNMYGLDLGIIHATKRGWVKGVRPVLGVFPYVGTPFKRSADISEEQIRRAYAGNFGAFAPMQTFSDLGVDMVTLAGKQWEDYMAGAKVLYDDFYDTAAKAGGKPIFSIKRTKKYAETALKKSDDAALKGSYGQVIQFPGTKSEAAFNNFYKELSQAPDTISAEQVRKLQEHLNNAIANYITEGGGMVNKTDMSNIRILKRMLEKDIADLSALPQSATAQDKALHTTLKNKLHKANKFITNLAPTFEGPIAEQLKMVNKEIFGEGVFKPGFFYDSEMMKPMMERATKDPKFMQNLMNMMTPSVGVQKQWQKMYGTKLDPDHFRKRLLQKWFDDAYQKSLKNLSGRHTASDYKALNQADKKAIKKHGFGANDLERTKFQDVIFDYDEFGRQLGLNSDEGRKVLDVALGREGAWKEVDRFLNAVSLSDLGKRVDPAQFVKRRITLGGAKAALGGVAIGTALTSGGIIGGPAGAVITAMLIRGFNEFLTDPAALKAMTEIVDNPVMTAQKKAFLIRMADRIFPSADQLENEERSSMLNKIILGMGEDGEDPKAEEDPWQFMQNLNTQEYGFGEDKKISTGTPFLSGAEPAGFKGQPVPKASFDTTIDEATGPVKGSSLAATNMASLGGGNNALAPNTRSALAFGGTDMAMAQRRANQGVQAKGGGIVDAFKGAA